ncbi:MAG: DNA helicase UvrD [Desulfobulbus propionicus]|nr:MAG: DNA helicase UvrD [Desulfobulbus propionicus]
MYPPTDRTDLAGDQPVAVPAWELNPAQYQAVTHPAGPVLVIAGAGSGKTRTLVHRVAYLLEQGVDPASILLLTFTRRAAQEMLWRAGQLTGQDSRAVTGGTFHATANFLLRRYGHHLDIGSGFTIIDRGDAEGIVNLLKSSLGFSGAGKRFPSKRVIVNLLSGAINKARTVEDLVYEGYLHLSEFIDDIYTIREHYAQFKRDNGLMDYDDLLVNWRRLLAESPEAREEICNRFTTVLVDEYQDTNPIQAEIVRLLAGRQHNVMVVGDDAQSIYSFRGADFQNIMRFPQQYPETSIIKLEENYRSTQPILELTNSIIAHAEEQFTKTLFSNIKGEELPLLYAARDEAAEARWVAERIEQLQKEGIALSQIAVLFRSGYHSYKLEMELASRAREYEKRGGLKLTESAHIKDVLCFFRVLVNPWDTLSWNRLLLQLDKVGPKTAQKITQTLKDADDPMQVLVNIRPAPSWEAGFEALRQTLDKLQGKDITPAAFFDTVMTYYGPVFEKIYHDDYPKRRRDIDQLQALVSGYGDIQSFVNDTALDPPETGAQGEGPQTERLVLSTIHSAKGLEWDAVFIIGLAEGRFPHQNAVPGSQYEEERRLLYVATTRARKALFLTYPRELVTPDRKFQRTAISPFLREIHPGLYVEEAVSPPDSVGQFTLAEPRFRGAARRKLGKGSAAVQGENLEVGTTVEHPFFGRGTIQAVPGPRRVEVAFARHGRKILHLDYANLDIVD